MSGEKDLDRMLRHMEPHLNEGEYVFCTLPSGDINILKDNVVGWFREAEGVTVVLNRHTADELHLKYDFIASWITLSVHSSLEAVGLTAAFSAALSKENISCNVIAAYYHDHIFVNKADGEKALQVLKQLSI
ncbi:MAG: ACT domain-containing protein [Chitinophagaceae bacterium]|nr:ACT domain-containing protein [Chitinophagaceae bacterium]